MAPHAPSSEDMLSALAQTAQHGLLPSVLRPFSGEKRVERRTIDDDDEIEQRDKGTFSRPHPNQPFSQVTLLALVAWPNPDTVQQL